MNIDGILNICKPRGISSFRALSIAKARIAKEVAMPSRRLKVGHLGTLDPMACGVLVLMCGRATKLANQLHAPTKVYRSLFVWGKETTTLDDEGEIIGTSNVIPTEQQIKSILPKMVGEIEIEVPKFSAVHIDGKRAYDLARKGIEFDAPKKTVKIERFELLSLDDCRKDLESIDECTKFLDTPDPISGPASRWYFEIECQTGTYIRSLAKLMADKMGTLAIASVIIRTKVGEFDIKNAKSLDEVTLDDLQTIPNVQF